MKKEDQEKALQEMRAGIAKIYHKRQEALKLKCSNCGGSFSVNDIGSVRCVVCEKIFYVEKLLNKKAL